MLRKIIAVVGVLITLGASPLLAGDGWTLNGSQGVMNLVVIDKDKVADQDTYRFAIAETCGIRPICQVLFWAAGSGAPASLPMSDAQVASKVAHWQYNANTGLRRLLWNCEVFKHESGDDCL